MSVFDASLLPIEQLLPHAPPMVLLDRVVEAAEEHLSATVAIRADSEFCRDGHVGAWVGIEYMAQAVAAWSGWRARERGEAVKIGFLLGTRRYEAHVGEFYVGDVLNVRVEREFQADNGLARFRAQIHRGADLCAEASISVYEPPSAP